MPREVDLSSLARSRPDCIVAEAQPLDFADACTSPKNCGSSIFCFPKSTQDLSPEVLRQIPEREHDHLNPQKALALRASCLPRLFLIARELAILSRDGVCRSSSCIPLGSIRHLNHSQDVSRSLAADAVELPVSASWLAQRNQLHILLVKRFSVRALLAHP